MRFRSRLVSSFVSGEEASHENYGIRKGVALEIEINCVDSKLVLKNEQNNGKYELDIDMKQFPLPWQIVLKLDHEGDCLHLQ